VGEGKPSVELCFPLAAVTNPHQSELAVVQKGHHVGCHHPTRRTKLRTRKTRGHQRSIVAKHTVCVPTHSSGLQDCEFSLTQSSRHIRLAITVSVVSSPVAAQSSVGPPQCPPLNCPITWRRPLQHTRSRMATSIRTCFPRRRPSAFWRRSRQCQQPLHCQQCSPCRRHRPKQAPPLLCSSLSSQCQRSSNS